MRKVRKGEGWGGKLVNVIYNAEAGEWDFAEVFFEVDVGCVFLGAVDIGRGKVEVAVFVKVPCVVGFYIFKGDGPGPTVPSAAVIFIGEIAILYNGFLVRVAHGAAAFDTVHGAVVAGG